MPLGGRLGTRDPAPGLLCPFPIASCVTHSQFCFLASWFLKTHRPGLRTQVLMGAGGDSARLQAVAGRGRAWGCLVSNTHTCSAQTGRTH